MVLILQLTTYEDHTQEYLVLANTSHHPSGFGQRDDGCDDF